MKIALRLVFASVLIVPVISTGLVFAEETTTAPGSSTDSTTTTTSSTEDRAAMQKRLEKRKTERKTKLTTTEEKRITERCTAAQGKLSSINGRIKGIETSRAQVYSNLVSRLTKVDERAKAQGINDAGLADQIGVLTSKIATFNTDLAAYKQAVSDLAAMDCKADPTAFKASLDAARSARQVVVKDAADIKSYVKTTIKPTLDMIRQSLAKDESKPEAESETEKPTSTGGAQ